METDKLAYFENLKKEIIQKAKDAEIDKKHIERDFQEKAHALQSEYQKKLDEVFKDAKNAAEKYRAELKAWAGATDGEPADILTVLQLISRFK